jgi:hypothetical protein
MTCDQFAEALADFLERDVSERARAAMEAHALECGECGPLLADLRRLRIDAANLPSLAPSRDLWRGVSDRIATPVVALPRNGSSAAAPGGLRRRAWFGVAAAALIAVTATVTHEITRRSIQRGTETSVAVHDTPIAAQAVATISSPAVPVGDSTADQTSKSASAAASRDRQPAPAMRAVSNKPSAEQTYDHEIARLLAVYKYKQHDLDSSTVAVVAKNMAIIDDAIAQCRLALRRDPASGYLLQSLTDALDTKVQLLRTAAALPSSRM